MKEYPKAYNSNKDIPYYPVFTSDNQKIYECYLNHLNNFDNLYAIGRLAEYRYYDMDDAVERAMSFFEDELR